MKKTEYHRKTAPRVSLVLLILICSFVLTACGSSSGYDYDDNKSWSYNDSVMGDSVNGITNTSSPSYSKGETADDADIGDSHAVQSPESEKIVYTMDMSVETTDFDTAVSAFEDVVKKHGGYILYSDTNGHTYTNADGTTSIIDRYARYQAAIPVAAFSKAVDDTAAIGNVTNKSLSAENVTSQYTDVSARIDSLRVQEERILAMMEKADDIDTLIKLESRLSDITYEKESYTRQMQNLERRIAYSTITVYISEVNVYTPVVAVTRTFGERLADAFADGWTEFVDGWQEFAVWLAEGLPTIVCFVVILAVFIAIIRAIANRDKRKAKAVTAQTQATNDHQSMYDLYAKSNQTQIKEEEKTSESTKIKEKNTDNNETR